MAEASCRKPELTQSDDSREEVSVGESGELFNVGNNLSVYWQIKISKS